MLINCLKIIKTCYIKSRVALNSSSYSFWGYFLSESYIFEDLSKLLLDKTQKVNCYETCLKSSP